MIASHKLLFTYYQKDGVDSTTYHRKIMVHVETIETYGGVGAVGISSSSLHHPTAQVGGPQEKMSFFQIASGPILSIPFHLKVCQYDPCKVSLKKMIPFLTYEPPKSAFFGISDWTSD